jgi:hypothetical protein
MRSRYPVDEGREKSLGFDFLRFLKAMAEATVIYELFSARGARNSTT